MASFVGWEQTITVGTKVTTAVFVLDIGNTNRPLHLLFKPAFLCPCRRLGDRSRFSMLPTDLFLPRFHYYWKVYWMEFGGSSNWPDSVFLFVREWWLDWLDIRSI